MKIILRILANCLAILIATKLIPGFIFNGTSFDLLLAGVFIGLVNALVKPIIEFIALPFIFLTLGLFSLIINVGLLLLIARFLDSLIIHGFWPAFWGIIILSLTNNLFTHLYKNNSSIN